MTPTLLHTEDALMLVDTGMPGMIKDFSSQIKAAGFSLRELTVGVLTHLDIDHIGSLPQLKKELPDIDVYAHEADKPYIN